MDEQTRSEWYNNKDLFEMIQELRKSMQLLQSDLLQTRYEIKQYNNLRANMNQCLSGVNEVQQDVNEVKQEVKEMKSEANGKKSVGVAVIAWTSFGIGIITLLAKMTGWF